jgi:DNA-binding response OmpR family regulator
MTILHIEDDPVMQDVVAETCSRFMSERKLVCAANLSEAQAAYKNDTPTLILLDQMLPDGDGLDWIQSLAPRPNCPILVTSGSDLSAFVRGYTGPLKLSFMAKPFRPRDLADRIQALMREI